MWPVEAVKMKASLVKTSGKKKRGCLKEMYFIITNNPRMEINNPSNLDQETITTILRVSKPQQRLFSCLGRALA